MSFAMRFSLYVMIAWALATLTAISIAYLLGLDQFGATALGFALGAVGGVCASNKANMDHGRSRQ